LRCVWREAVARPAARTLSDRQHRCDRLRAEWLAALVEMKSLAETHPDAVAMAKRLASVGKRKPSLRTIAAAGLFNERGKPFAAKSIAAMLTT
jgi:hypothetical protein